MTKVVDNAAEKRFEATVEDTRIRIDYIKTKDKIFLTHTEVPPSLGGKGYASELVRQTLILIKDMPLALVPLCPFVAAYLKKNPIWQDLLAEGYSV